ncbi:cytochrome P450, putative [Talaromyces stipitatus ATCC 10500]|uniref:Cytochrome P450, putative n=1 Tax=Talaromyces stipitatus (strain ATCC 10500 / CBS 375.48 / QM 6759 / NRRL 1006) TaxID=441959 RepID=B8MF04_TALSN|nr:cytochrome P450, putative [Talaromyces stipitatus ATCC 10500]EED15773.1 cytochrome P450, putative [Talaromyces stipitatus ATCC 10500]
MFLNNRYNNGLIKYPGPFIASLTNMWRVRDAYVNGGKRPSYVTLHRVYGEVVRLGPKALSFASPAAVNDIYRPEKNMAKSGWYVAFEAHGKGRKKENIFSTRDIHWHARYRGLVSPGFKITNLAPKEKEVDELIKKLLRNLNDAARSTDKSSSLIDLPLHLQYFTFDAGGVFAFSQPYGFLDQKTDLDGIIQSVRVGSTHLNRLAQAPLGQLLFDKNPLAVYFGFIAPPMAFAKKYLPTQRIEEQLNNPNAMGQHHDLLDQFLEAHKNSPDIVTRNEVVDLGLMVVVPASEAVRTAIAALIYHVLKVPEVLTKLRREIDSILTDRDLIPSWEVVSKQLPYLDACIKETFRIHPSTGFNMERIVPAGGAVIDGHFVPEDSIVSCSTWVIHRHKPTYGDDIETFRPERWLEATSEQRAEMERLLCPFGFESRLCLGREIGLFEVYKVSATLLREYDFTLEKPNEDMRITWGNIVSVDFNVWIKPRKL